MNITPQWVKFFERLGYQAVHWASVGRPDAQDTEIIDWAREQDWVILTGDLDFGAIQASSDSSKPSIVQLRSEITLPAYIGSAVAEAVRQSEPDLIAGALLTIASGRSRLRLLPFRREQ